MIQAIPTKNINTIFSCKDIAIEVEWNDELKIGGVFKRVPEGRGRYRVQKLANIFDEESAKELEAVMKQLFQSAIDFGKIRDNY